MSESVCPTCQTCHCCLLLSWPLKQVAERTRMVALFLHKQLMGQQHRPTTVSAQEHLFHRSGGGGGGCPTCWVADLSTSAELKARKIWGLLLVPTLARWVVDLLAGGGVASCDDKIWWNWLIPGYMHHVRPRVLITETHQCCECNRHTGEWSCWFVSQRLNHNSWADGKDSQQETALSSLSLSGGKWFEAHRLGWGWRQWIRQTPSPHPTGFPPGVYLNAAFISFSWKSLFWSLCHCFLLLVVSPWWHPNSTEHGNLYDLRSVPGFKLCDHHKDPIIKVSSGHCTAT